MRPPGIRMVLAPNLSGLRRYSPICPRQMHGIPPIFSVCIFSRGEARNFNPWVSNFCNKQFGYPCCYIGKYFTHLDLSFPQNLLDPFHAFEKSVGVLEPTEPTLAAPLVKTFGLEKCF